MGNTMRRALPIRFLAFVTLAFSLILATSTGQAQQAGAGIMSNGDAAVTGFSGTVSPAGRAMIDPEGASLKIFDFSGKGPARGQLLSAPVRHKVPARDIGQVFGVALDNATPPNIYVTATSAFGLSIVDAQGAPLSNGAPGATFMPGQFGQNGGPGSVWIIDGTTGIASLFATIRKNSTDNSGAGLGNITFDATHYQLFVSDLESGLIHRLDLQGNIIDSFDHGATGRPAGGLDAVPGDATSKADINSPEFDTENSDTWGLADIRRRVWGLIYYKNRLYYSPSEGPQIWSVGINNDGSFATDARIEIQAIPGGFPVADMLFTAKGQMIVAQRGGMLGSAQYTQFHTPKFNAVLRYSKDASGQWIQQPDEYAIGLPADHKNAAGGVGLACGNVLWSTGDALGADSAMADQLSPQGDTVVHGLQGNKIADVRPANTPPGSSWFVNFAEQPGDPQNAGHTGDVAIYRDCRADIDQSGYIDFKDFSYYDGYGGWQETWPGWTPDWVPPTGWVPPPRWPTVPDLRVQKSNSKCTRVGNSLLMRCRFLITVTNVSGVPYTGQLNVVDDVAAGLTLTPPYVGSIPWTCNQGAGAGTLIVCRTDNVFTLAPGQSQSISIGLTYPIGIAPRVVKNCARSTIPDAYTGNNRDCGFGYPPAPGQQPKPDLKVEKTLLKCELAPSGSGNNICEYSLKISNVGNAPFVGTAEFSDIIPAGLMWASPVATNGWSCSLATNSMLTCIKTNVNMAVGASFEHSIRLEVPPGTATGLENCIGITSGTVPRGPVSANDLSCAPIEVPKIPKYCPKGWTRYPTSSSVPQGWITTYVGTLVCAKPGPVEGPKCTTIGQPYETSSAVPNGWISYEVTQNGVTIWCAYPPRPTQTQVPPPTLIPLGICAAGERPYLRKADVPRGWKSRTIHKTSGVTYCAKPQNTKPPKPLVSKQCAPGTHFDRRRNKCVSNTPRCGRNQHLSQGKCVNNKPSCGRNQHVSQGRCVNNTPRCGRNQHVSRGKCVNNTLRCGRNQHVSRGKCVTNTLRCGRNQHVSRGRCVTNTIRCRAGTHREGNRCVRNARTNPPSKPTGRTNTPTRKPTRTLRCPRGTKPFKGRCVKT